jgi:enterochelin esterase-like enzyme
MNRFTPIALFLAFALPFTHAADRIKSPEVDADGRVTFRYADTGATKVEVSIANVAGKLEMARKDGVWTGTTAPLTPETYWYSFIVDGRSELDPVNGTVIGNLIYLNSAVKVPGATPQPWDVQDVPHGVVHHHRYTSHIAKGLPGGHSDYYIYTPPGYSPSAGTALPVLYLLHGYSDTADDWTQLGKADVILDNLIASGKAKPMVVVMPLGYGDMGFVKQDYETGIDHNIALFERVLLDEIKPAVENEYNVSRRQEDRAIAGLSMGGDESLRIGLGHPELFASVGGFSGNSDFVLAGINAGRYDADKAALKVLWLSSGTHEGDDLVQTRAMVAALRGRGFTVAGEEAEGMHTWNVWHQDLIHFAPLLFR